MLGIPVEWVVVSTPDTDVTPYDQSTNSSRTAFSMGHAAQRAAGAKELAAKLRDFSYRAQPLPAKLALAGDAAAPDYFRQFAGLDAGAWGAMLFGETITLWTVAGAVIVLTGMLSLVMVRREAVGIDE